MARERYLLNAEEETIHQGTREMTSREKRENWWFYHKFHLLAFVLIGSAVFSLFYSIFSQVEPDYTIAVVTSFNLPENGQRELKKCIAPYAEDRNGDGKVAIEVMNYVFTNDVNMTSDAYQRQEASMAKLMADCGSNESMIFLHDETAFAIFYEDFDRFFQYNDGAPMPEGARDYENAMIPWDEVAAFANFEPEIEPEDVFDRDSLLILFGRLRCSVRSGVGGSIEKKEKDRLYHQDSLALYQRLKDGTPLPAEGN